MKPRTPPPLWRATRWIFVLMALAAAYSLSWRVTQPNFLKLIVAAPKAKQIIGDFLRPDIIKRDAQITLSCRRAARCRLSNTRWMTRARSPPKSRLARSLPPRTAYRLACRRRSVPLNRIHVSQAMRDVLNAIMVTIFMALLSTTLGTIIAAPLSFLAASNITRTSKLGSVVYYLVRSLGDITRPSSRS